MVLKYSSGKTIFDIKKVIATGDNLILVRENDETVFVEPNSLFEIEE